MLTQISILPTGMNVRKLFGNSSPKLGCEIDQSEGVAYPQTLLLFNAIEIGNNFVHLRLYKRPDQRADAQLRLLDNEIVMIEDSQTRNGNTIMLPQIINTSQLRPERVTSVDDKS
jgi:hypothetical protein